MSKLGAALRWAARGFRVFPLAEGTKDQPLVSHSIEATTDVSIITAWWKDPVTGAERNHNVGISTTDMVVVDLDTRDGKQGVANYLGAGGTFDTFTVRTPSGGFHLYFHGPDSATVANLLGSKNANSGVDIRSHGGYVVAAGSETQAGQRTSQGAYTVEQDLSVAIVPDAIAGRLRKPLTRDTAATAALEETPGLVDAGRSFLASTAPAVQGLGGDQTTYQTACRLRDLGMSERGTLALLLIHWNDRCVPPWPIEELAVKVNNAYSYATGSAGSMAPEVLFSRADIPEPPPPPPPIDMSGAFRFGNAIEPNDIPARPWLYTRFLMRGQVTMLTGGGAAGKSTLALTTAAHLALGREFLGFPLRGGPQRSIIYDHEDDVVEMSRRLWAVCQWFSLPYADVKARVALLSRKELNLRLTAGKGDGLAMHEEHVRAIAEAAAPPDIGLVVAGPLVSLHTANEDDNMAMAFVMEILHAVADVADVALLVHHHVSKTNGTMSRAGDPNAARGASAIINEPRLSYTIWTPTKDECEKFGISPDKRFDFVRLDDAKMNYAKQRGLAGWLKKESARLPAGDDVGVLVPYDMAATTDVVMLGWSTIIAAEMKGASRATCTLNEAANMLKAGDQLMAKLTADVLRTRVKTALASPRRTEHGTVKFAKIMNGGKMIDTVVLE